MQSNKSYYTLRAVQEELRARSAISEGSRERHYRRAREFRARIGGELHSLAS